MEKNTEMKKLIPIGWPRSGFKSHPIWPATHSSYVCCELNTYYFNRCGKWS